MRTAFRITFPVLLVAMSMYAGGATADADDVVRIGVIADVHAHDADSPAEGKVMTNYGERLAVFVEAMNAWPAETVVELGDLVNGNFIMGPLGDAARIPGILEDAMTYFEPLGCPLVHVIGNHDVYDLDKPTYLEILGEEATYYSFDLGAFHFVVLDAQFETTGEPLAYTFWRVLGTVPTFELDWLRADLASTEKPTVVLVHQPIDSEFDTLAGGPPISNNHEVQALLEEAGNVVAVFQGHDHENRYEQINGIHYVTFVEFTDHVGGSPVSFATVELDAAARTITIDGVGMQESLQFTY